LFGPAPAKAYSLSRRGVPGGKLHPALSGGQSISRFKWHGTHRGVPGTGRYVAVKGIVVDRISLPARWWIVAF
jgi:hypothetical protein